MGITTPVRQGLHNPPQGGAGLVGTKEGEQAEVGELLVVEVRCGVELWRLVHLGGDGVALQGCGQLPDPP